MARGGWMFLALAGLLAWPSDPLLAADEAKRAPLPRHADTQLAHELLRLRQVDILRQEEQSAAGTAAANMWKAERLVAQWDELAKNKEGAGGGGGQAAAGQDYLGALTAYLKSGPRDIDGAWALDHAQFILSKLSQPILTRMEYWSNNPKDRKALEPLATLATKLLGLALTSLEGAMQQAEARKPFDEAAYTLSYAAAADVKYYGAWAAYFRAMAMEPGGGEGAARQKVMVEAATALNEWAVDEPDNGVNFQAYLLRGKVNSEGRDFPKAMADFKKAQSEKAPNWVQYQARYQAVVASLRAHEYRLAQSGLEAFKRSIPKENQEARLSADMLGYRVAWALAEVKTDARERGDAEREALDILGGVIQKDPRFRDLVYEQLASQLPENADVATLQPMQQLAVAYFDSQGQRGDTPESRQQLKRAADAAVAVRSNAAASRTDKVEATYLAGACDAVLGNLPEAAKYNVEFAEMSPGDVRAKPMVELALQQIGELRKLAASGGGPGMPGAGPEGAGGAATAGTVPGNDGFSPELRSLAERALHLSVDIYGETRWKYAQARMFEDAGKGPQAAAIYDKLPAEDPNYLDARYRLVTLATSHFSQMPANAQPADVKNAAQDVFKACSAFVELLDHPPASAPPDVLARAKTYRYDIWIIEAATALNPAVKQSDVALDRLDRLGAAKAMLSDAQKGAVLRYRILAYQMAGEPDKALEVVREYAASEKNGQDALGVIRSMVLSTLDEINRIEKTDPGQSKALAKNVVGLLDLIIKPALAEGKKDTAVEYQVIQADMMVRAGEYKEAQQLADELLKEKPDDVRINMADARAMFAEAQATGDLHEYAKAQDYFTRILKNLSPGSESHWEAWLRIIESMEAGGGERDAVSKEIKTKLGDLKGIYGSKFGGETFKADFDGLAEKYGVR